MLVAKVLVFRMPPPLPNDVRQWIYEAMIRFDKNTSEVVRQYAIAFPERPPIAHSTPRKIFNRVRVLAALKTSLGTEQGL